VGWGKETWRVRPSRLAYLLDENQSQQSENQSQQSENQSQQSENQSQRHIKGGVRGRPPHTFC
jgi:hypothetical protein